MRTFSIILVILASAIGYHFIFNQEFCRNEIKNYIIFKIEKKKCYKGIMGYARKEISREKIVKVLPPWAK